MARVRSRELAQNNVMLFNNQFPRTWASTTSGNIRTGRISKSTMTDILDVTYRNVCKPVSHVSDKGAYISCSQMYVKNDTPPKYTEIAVKSGGILHSVPSVTLPTVEWNTLLNDLGSRVSQKIERKQLLAVTLLEFGKTVEMIKNPFSLLRPDGRKYARLLPAAAAKSFSRMWLETRYGWQQLYRDIKDGASAVQAIYRLYKPDTPEDEDSGLLERRFSAGRTYDLAVPPPSVTQAKWDSDRTTMITSYTFNRAVYLKRQYIANVFGIDEHIGRRVVDNVDILCGTFGLTADDLLTILWEVVPYSFVVDWFVNVGDWALSMRNNKKLLRAVLSRYGYSTCVRTHYRRELAIGTWPNIPGEFVWDRSFPLSGYPETFQSEVTTHSVYNRYATLPSSTSYLGNGLSTTQLLDGVTLLIQKLIS